MIKIKRIGNGKHQIQFDLHRMEKDGKLKSKLISFDDGSAVRVYWDSQYDGLPKIVSLKNNDCNHNFCHGCKRCEDCGEIN